MIYWYSLVWHTSSLTFQSKTLSMSLMQHINIVSFKNETLDEFRSDAVQKTPPQSEGGLHHAADDTITHALKSHELLKFCLTR